MMKRIVSILSFLLICFFSFAQNKNEVQVLANVKALHQAIFVDKDSLALENLLAKDVTYGHSGGKLENRKEVIENCSHNKSTYTNMGGISPISVNIYGTTAVTRYVLTGTETKIDGKATELKLNILQVWVKEKKAWKMVARQAVKLS
jgi:Domain of unknown function (DUF4440)